MSTQKNLITLCFATVLTLGLAACGGGGDAPAPGMTDMDGDGSLEGKYIPSGTTIPDLDYPDAVVSAARGEEVTVPGLGTVECASDDGCSATVVDGVLTIMGDLKIVSVDAALDDATAMVLAGLAVDMLPDAPDPAIGQREAISSAIAAANTAVGVVTDAATDAEVAAADMAIATAKMAIADAANVPAEEAAANSGTVSVLETVLANAKTSRTAAIADAAEAVRLAAEATAKAVTTKAAGTKLKALGAEAEQDADEDAGLGGSARTDAEDTGNDGTANDVYTLTIKRDRTDTTITVKDPDRPSINEAKFELAADMGDGRQMFVLENDADADGDVVEEVVIVGTDIRAPRAVAFARVDNQELNARDLDTTVDADKDGEADNDFTALFVGEDAMTGPLDPVKKLVKSDTFTSTTAAVLMFEADVTSTTGKDEAREVAGYYNGAKGTYRCDGDSVCTVTIGKVEGKLTITEMTAGWIFTPNADVTSDVADTSYLYYGFWLKKTTDEDDVLTYNEVETFAGASIALAPTGTVENVVGTASYDGDAVGVYVHHELSEGGGQVESSTSGHFKADASLTATFGQKNAVADDIDTGTIAPGQLNSITGTIDNFALAGGEENDWSVTLAKGPIVPADGIASGMAHGGGAPGKYSATFHGLADATVQPSAVVGEFDANFSNGAVAGGFGANKQ